jgi:hypothetical protein
VTVVDDDTLVDEEVNQWEDICADIIQTEDQAELYIKQITTSCYQMYRSEIRLRIFSLPFFYKHTLHKYIF